VVTVADYTFDAGQSRSGGQSRSLLGTVTLVVASDTLSSLERQLGDAQDPGAAKGIIENARKAIKAQYESTNAEVNRLAATYKGVATQPNPAASAWVGSFNMTSVDKAPLSEVYGDAMRRPSKIKPACLTQSKWGREQPNTRKGDQLGLCTSCRPVEKVFGIPLPVAFSITHAKNREGVCQPVTVAGHMLCAQLGTNTKAPEHIKSTLCTRIGLLHSDIDVDTLEPDAKKVLAAYQGLEGKAMAKCVLKKETQCTSKGTSLECIVKKFVNCYQVCKFKSWIPKMGNKCKADVCNLPYKKDASGKVTQTYGQFVCARAAMMA